MATKKSEAGEGVEVVTKAPAKVTYESIAVDLLDKLVANGNRESPMHEIVVRALGRVADLQSPPPEHKPMKAVEA
jgi:hypothetical protein